MVYKDFSSPLLERVRGAASALRQRRFLPFDPQVDMLSQCYSERRMAGADILLENAEREAVAFVSGGMGEEDEPVFAYMLMEFPASDLTYEFIAYRYNADKFFLSRNGRLIGCLSGGFVSDLRQVGRWELMVDDRVCAYVDVPANLGSGPLELEFKDGRPAAELSIASPPKYHDFISAVNYHVRKSFGLSLGPNRDLVFVSRPEWRSLREAELIFASFVFFRLLVFRNA